MNFYKKIVLVLITLILYFPGYAHSIPAFPGAEGGGGDSIGGRGGRVIKVVNLNDNGPGSFREAVSVASGPRIVVFDVSGIIDLDSPLEIVNPYLTIAGETSPGGVLIASWPTRITAHDIIVRHMRFRNGCRKCFLAGNCELGDTLAISATPPPYKSNVRQDSYNVIIDHSSVSWGCDETVDISPWNAVLERITISNSIIAEGVNDAHPEANHARGVIMWGRKTLPGKPIRVTFLRNLVMSFYSRLPLANFNVSFDFVNNVVYNFSNVITPTIEPMAGYKIETNMIHNYMKPGPNSLPSVANGGIGRDMFVVGDSTNPSNGHVTGAPYEMIYMAGNIGYTRQTQTGDDWSVSEGWSPTNLLNKAYQRTIPFPTLGGAGTYTFKTMSETCADVIVDNAGATKPVRDSVDARLISEYKAGDRGNYINMADVVFPTFQTPPPPVDLDNDGMADSWEILEGLNPSVNDSALDKDGDGYTNIEEYLHSLADMSNVFDPNCLPNINMAMSPPPTDTTPPSSPTNFRVN